MVIIFISIFTFFPFWTSILLYITSFVNIKIIFIKKVVHQENLSWLSSSSLTQYCSSCSSQMDFVNARDSKEDDSYDANSSRWWFVHNLDLKLALELQIQPNPPARLMWRAFSHFGGPCGRCPTKYSFFESESDSKQWGSLAPHLQSHSHLHLLAIDFFKQTRIVEFLAEA